MNRAFVRRLQVVNYSVDGATTIGPIEDAMRQTIRDKPYTAGEILRLGQMVPAEKVRRDAQQQLRILD